MKQEKPEDRYRRADVDELSKLYFDSEGKFQRRKHFEELWLAVGFHSQLNPYSIKRTYRLLGKPDLAQGTPDKGMVAWLMHSVHSCTADTDTVVGFDVAADNITAFWSNSVEPECSPARHMQPFEKSEMNQGIASNNGVEDIRR